VTSPDEVVGLEFELPPSPPADCNEDRNFPIPESASVSLQSSMRESRRDCGRDSLP
jgi:hypothetical protein